MKSVLIHCCCAHCTAYTVEHWRKQGHAISAFWYNPNIHLYLEHQHRLEAVKYLALEMKFPLVEAGDYDLIEYFRRVVGHEAERCQYCFDLRLSRTAESALEMGFDAFTTTLLISPHQKHDLLWEIGSRIAAEKGIEFLYVDLRKHYSDSRHRTKPMDLYRQQYCGCIYSEWERHAEITIE